MPTTEINLIVNSSGAKKGFNDYTRGAKRATKETSKLQKSVRDTASSVSLIRGPLDGVAARFTNISGALGRGLTPATIAAGVAFTGLALGVGKSLSAFATYERTLGRVQGVFRATGNAAGFTAQEIDKFAIDLGRTTLQSRQSVLEAAAALGTFRNIAGQAFIQTIKRAADLSEVLGQDLRSTTVQLAKALEDPIRGLSNLRRVGVSFTESQEKVIKQLVRTGQTAAAQAKILDVLNEQVGGAAVKAAEGLAGTLDTLNESWNEFLTSVGSNLGPLANGFIRFADAVINPIDSVKLSLLALESAIFDFKPVIITETADLEETEKDLERVKRGLVEARKRAEEAQTAWERFSAGQAIRRLSDQFVELSRELNNLTFKDAQASAKQAEQAQVALKLSLANSTDEIRKQGAELGFLIDQGFSLAEAQEIQKLAQEKGLEITSELIQEQVFAKRANEEYIQSIKDREAAEAKANTAASERVSVIDEQLALLEQLNDSGASQVEIEAQLSAQQTLGNEASQESIELLAERTSLLKAETEAVRERARVQEEQTNIGENIDSLRDQVEALEAAGAETKEFNKVLEQQRAQQRLGKSATEEQVDEYIALQERLSELKEINKEAFDPTPLEIFAERSSEVARNSQDAFVSFATSASQELAKFATGAEANFRRLFASLIQQLIQVQIQAAIAKSVGGSGGGIFGSLFGGIAGIFGGGAGAAAASAPSPLQLSSPIPQNFTPIPGFANGGDFSAGQTMLVGERGPEIVQFGSPGTVFPTGTGPSGGVSVAQTLNFNGFSGEQRDARIIAEAVERSTAASVNEVIRLSQAGGRESKMIRGN